MELKYENMRLNKIIAEKVQILHKDNCSDVDLYKLDMDPDS